MNDILLPAIKDLFKLTYTQASLVQQSFYLVYLFFPIPIAYYIARFGYKRSLITALLICSAASLIFVPAYYYFSFIGVLIALFVISIGVTFVNVAANPLAAMLGTKEGAHVRVNIVQLFSRIGFSFTPILATRLIYANSTRVDFHFPYLLIGGGAFLLAIIFLFSKLSVPKPARLENFTPVAILRESKKYPQLRWGVLAMFFYMGAEACTAGFFISYLKEVSGFDDNRTSQYLSYYYMASTIVSFIGVFLIDKFSPGKILIWFSLGLIAMYILAAFTTTMFNGWYMLGMGVFISILFSLIFSLSIEGLGVFTEKGSALINMAIVGGAVFPPIQGLLADYKGVQLSYITPVFCVLAIILFGLYCNQRFKTQNVNK